MRCSAHVVDLLHGSLVTVGLALSSEGFEPSAQHVGFGGYPILDVQRLAKSQSRVLGLLDTTWNA